MPETKRTSSDTHQDSTSEVPAAEAATCAHCTIKTRITNGCHHTVEPTASIFVYWWVVATAIDPPPVVLTGGGVHQVVASIDQHSTV